MLHPEDKIAVGRFGRSYGVLGWIHVHSYTHPFTNLLNYPLWQITCRDQWQSLHLETGKAHRHGLIAKVKEIDSPESAKMYTNLEIYIHRDELPALGHNEYYWDDLLGCEVINQHQQKIGVITEILETGANEVLVAVDPKQHRHLIPYIDSVIDHLDIKQKTLFVHWTP